jgi:hypothetical protein
MQMAPAELVDEEAAGYLQLQKDFKELRKWCNTKDGLTS